MSRLLLPVDGSCVLYLPFWEGAGTFTEDISRYKNHGTITGATWADGVLGKALSFDGSDFVLVDWTPSLDFGLGDFTVCCWVKGGDQGAGEKIIIRKDDEGGASRHLWSLIAVGTVGYFEMYDDGVWVTTANVQIGDNNWHQLVGVRDGDLIKFYRDGVFQVQANGCAGISATNVAGHIALGRYETTAGAYYTGIIDEPRLFNRVLSDAEVFEEYYRGVRGNY